MRTAASVNQQPQELTYGTFNGFAYMPAMPGYAYRVLLMLVGTQEPGGRCLVTEDNLADALGVHRSIVGRGLKHLMLAKLVFRQAKGVYLLNPMISGGRTVTEHLDAIGGLDHENRLDVDDYQERYEAALAQAEREKQEKRLERKSGEASSKPASKETAVAEDTDGVVDIAAARKRASRQRARV